MADYGRRWWTLTPFRIALVYLLVGGTWVLLSDQFVAALPVAEPVPTWLQTAKGWLFVGASGLLIYALTARGRSQLERSNERLQRTLRHSSVLHRVLRHDLRNACNVIDLQAERLAEQAEDGQEPKRAIERQVEELLELGQKSGQLRRITLAEQRRREIDLQGLLAAEVEWFTERYPDASVELDIQEGLTVVAYPELERAVHELFENAAEHAAGEVSITVGARRTGDVVTVDVADDGPGLPEMEREVLHQGVERPLTHSEGLGLWLVRVIVDESGGELEVVDNEPEGTVVRLRLPAGNRREVPAAEGYWRQTVYPPATL